MRTSYRPVILCQPRMAWPTSLPSIAAVLLHYLAVYEGRKRKGRGGGVRKSEKCEFSYSVIATYLCSREGKYSELSIINPLRSE